MMGSKVSSIVREITGSFADLGTLLPLLLGLIVCNGVGAGRACVLLGITYIVVGAYYRVPVPVQPMKALAMIAITTGASTGQVRAAAYWMAVILLILGVTRLVDRLSDIFPRFLIHVLQLNLGIMMVRTGVKFLLSYPATVAPGGQHVAGHGISSDILPSVSDFQVALLLLVIPQVPLTLGNAIVATRDCAVNYFGPRSARVTPAGLAISMGAANAASAICGGIPICHGAGGMTAHYRLGARTGFACGVIGSLFLIVGVLEGESASALLSLMPAAVLGLLLAHAGIRHALLAQESFRSRTTALVMLSSAVAGWFCGNLLIPLSVGLFTHFLMFGLSRVVWVGSRRI